MRKNQFKQIVLILPTLFCFSKAMAWGDIGHSTVAEIAERNLTPKARDMVFNIIGLEPMSTSATFPDSVRSDSRFGLFAPYHFIEIPLGKTYATMSDAEKPDRNSDTIISKVPTLLTRPDITREQKMLMLRYLIHVVGDVHQPLHVGNGQDMGANLCDIKWKDPETGHVESSNLHSFMDDIAVKYIGSQNQTKGKKKWFGYKELAEIIMNDVKLGNLNFEGKEATSMDVITKAGPQDWYEQSRAYHKVVYPDASPTTPEKRTYCKVIDPTTKKVVNGSYDAKTIPTITKAQADRLVPIIKLQILRGGYRLAYLLNKTAERFQDLRPMDTRAFVDSVLITNRTNDESRFPQAEKPNKK